MAGIQIEAEFQRLGSTIDLSGMPIICAQIIMGSVEIGLGFIRLDHVAHGIPSDLLVVGSGIEIRPTKVGEDLGVTR